MKILFVGGLFSEEKKDFFFSKTKASFENAANALQWEIVHGLELNLGKSLSIFSVPFVGDYPRDYSDLFVKGFPFRRYPGDKSVSVGFFNLKIFNFFSKYLSCKRALHKYMQTDSGESDQNFVVVYGVHAYLILAAAYLKRQIPGVRICLVVPDLPDMMGGDSSRLVIKVFNLINNHFVSRGLNSVDCFVLLSKHMTDRLPIEGRPWCVVEGIAGERALENTKKDAGTFSILYSGTLAKRYGVLELLDAFSKIRGEKFRLWICGAGDGEADVKRAAELDSRIVFFGQIARGDALLMQQQADVLINPRTSEGDYTKYSFPSKIMEYFSSGTPSILNHLQGIPEEYFSYCIVPESEDADGLRNAILRVEAMGEDARHQLGSSARNFILSCKSARIQSMKIIELIRAL